VGRSGRGTQTDAWAGAIGIVIRTNQQEWKMNWYYKINCETREITTMTCENVTEVSDVFNGPYSSEMEANEAAKDYLSNFDE
jgi:hypothetical protein